MYHRHVIARSSQEPGGSLAYGMGDTMRYIVAINIDLFGGEFGTRFDNGEVSLLDGFAKDYLSEGWVATFDEYPEALDAAIGVITRIRDRGTVGGHPWLMGFMRDVHEDILVPMGRLSPSDCKTFDLLAKDIRVGSIRVRLLSQAGEDTWAEAEMF